MGKLTDSIQSKIHEAMKGDNPILLSTLRLLSSAFSYEKIAKMRELTDAEEIDVIKREAKKRADSIEVYEKVGSLERAENEKKELAILREYLPPEMSDEDLNKIIDGVVAELKPTGMVDMGRTISAVIAKAPNADGKKISERVRQYINNAPSQ